MAKDATLVVLWADGSSERFTESIHELAERMADYSSRPAPPDMRIEPPGEPTAGPPALSSPVEDDVARARRMQQEFHRFPWKGAGSYATEALAAEFARIRAEAVAAERGAVVAIIQAVEDEVPDGYDVVNLVSVMIERIRARGPAPAQQEETHEKD